MTQLTQLIAVQKGVTAKAERDLTDVYHKIQKPVLLAGIARSYTPKDTEGQQLPAERTKVQLDVETALAQARVAVSRLFDVRAALDTTNCTAKADVVVGDETILTDVPVTYLLFLDKQLTNLRTFFSKLPTLDPAEEWHRDDSVNAWATDPTETVRTAKVPRNHVLAPATDKHPAQVQVWQEDIVVGTWSTRKFSGALAEKRKQGLLDRVDALLTAVKYAREKANTTEVVDREFANAVFDFLQMA